MVQRDLTIHQWNVNIYKETCEWICSRCQHDRAKEPCGGFRTWMEGNVYKIGCINMIPKEEKNGR